MQKKTYDETKLKRLRELFDSFMTALEKVDPGLFRLTGRFSIAVFEAAFYAKCHNLWGNEKKVDLKPMSTAELQKLSGALRESLQEGTAKREHVLKRLEIASQSLSP